MKNKCKMIPSFQQLVPIFYENHKGRSRLPFVNGQIGQSDQYLSKQSYEPAIRRAHGNR